MMQKMLFFIYELIWKTLIPFLRFHHRLAEGFAERRLEKRLPKADIWIQAASVGEAGLVAEILRELRPPRPLTILLTANTRQGVEILQDTAGTCPCTPSGISRIYVRYFPFDTPSLMKKAVRQADPLLMVLLETEIWPGLLAALKDAGTRCLILNGRISPRSLKRYSIISSICPSVWKSLHPDQILAISPEDAKRFGILFGREGIATMPNIKFDRIPLHPAKTETQNPLRLFIPSFRPFIVLGSVRQEEEKEVEKIIRRVLSECPHVCIGLFPRHFHRVSFWESRLQGLNISALRRSQFSFHSPAAVTDCSVLLWDTFGELADAYGLADATFVGGSLAPLGGQNFLEPVIYGLVPVIGPYRNHFQWVGTDIFEKGLVRTGRDWQEVSDYLIRDIQNIRKTGNNARSFRKKTARQYFAAHRGGSRQACRVIESAMNGEFITP